MSENIPEENPEPDIHLAPAAEDANASQPADQTNEPAAPKSRRTRAVIITAAAVVTAAVLVIVGVNLFTSGTGQPKPAASGNAVIDHNPNPHPSDAPAHYTKVSAIQAAALPQASYDAVITSLIPRTTVITGPVQVASVARTTALYDGAGDPVAHFDALNFRGTPTVVVVIEHVGAWSKVLTPARVSLPSKTGGNAPAQSAAWLRTDQLSAATTVTAHVNVSLKTGTMVITGQNGATQSFPVGFGDDQNKTPTPTGVTGYIQARYVDASQGTGTYPIQLTSLHGQTKDEAYTGSIGSLIALHYWSGPRAGGVSHGCVRMASDAVTAVNALPLGTPVTVSSK